MTGAARLGGRTLEHEAFVYSGDDEYVGVLAPLVAARARDGDAVFAVVPRRRAALLRDALGGDAASVRWIDSEDWYRQPVRTLAGYERILRGLPPGGSALVIGEVEFGDTDDDRRAWTRYEAVLNRALAAHPAHVVCPYDARSLPGPVLADARRTHPHLRRPGGRHGSEHYLEPEALLEELAADIALPKGEAVVELRDVRSIREGRRAFAAVAARCGFSGEQLHELVIGVSEVLTNAVLHGGGASTFRLWAEDEVLTCVVEDDGAGDDDPLLGLLPPAPDADGGYGLWFARQVFDRSDVTRSPLGGLLVHLAARAPHARGGQQGGARG